MSTQNTNTTQYVDTVTQDFKTSVAIVSLTANLAVFIAWLTISI